MRSQNGQTHFKNLASFAVRFLKGIWTLRIKGLIHYKDFPKKIYLSKVNNRNIRKRCETCSKLTNKTPERRLCWSLFLMRLQAFRPATLLKRDSNTGVFLRNLQKFWRTRTLKNICERLLLTDYYSVYYKNTSCYVADDSSIARWRKVTFNIWKVIHLCKE